MNEILFVNRASIRVLLLKITRHGQQRERQTMLAGECFICLDLYLRMLPFSSLTCMYLHAYVCFLCTVGTHLVMEMCSQHLTIVASLTS